MTTPTYKQQFDKITEAYIGGKIEPYLLSFCFCGTIAIDKSEWRDGDRFYSKLDYHNMEDALLTTIKDQTVGGIDKYFGSTNGTQRDIVKNHSNYETALFNGMCAALEVLRQIHESKGENTEYIPLQKRQLQTV